MSILKKEYSVGDNRQCDIKIISIGIVLEPYTSIHVLNTATMYKIIIYYDAL